MFAYCRNSPISQNDAQGMMGMEYGSTVDGIYRGGYSGGSIVDSKYLSAVGKTIIVALSSIVAIPMEGRNYIRSSVDAVVTPKSFDLKKDVNRPSKGKVSIAMDHIISGHTAGGNRGSSNKDCFPWWMTEKTIEKAIRIAYDNAEKAGAIQYSWENGVEVAKQLYRGSYDGMLIYFWYNITKKIIETAWPK